MKKSTILRTKKLRTVVIETKQVVEELRNGSIVPVDPTMDNVCDRSLNQLDILINQFDLTLQEMVQIRQNIKMGKELNPNPNPIYNIYI